jgi:hypothetical protein
MTNENDKSAIEQLLREKENVAGFWFGQCVNLAKAITGAETFDLDRTTDKDISLVIDGKVYLVDWPQIVGIAAAHCDAMKQIAAIRAAVAKWKNHETNKGSWEHELISDVQKVLQVKLTR